MADSPLDQITLLQEVAQDRLDKQLDVLDSLDTKLVSFLSIGAGLVVAVTGIAAIDVSKLPSWIALPLAVMVLSFAVLFGASAYALRAQSWTVGANLDEVEQSIVKDGIEMTRRRLTRTILDGVTVNDRAYRRKVESIRPVFVALIVEAVAALVALASLVHL